MNFSVPDDVKDAFNETFSGQNKSAIIIDLTREAVERSRRLQRSRAAIDRLLREHEAAPTRTAAELRAARTKGRP